MYDFMRRSVHLKQPHTHIYTYKQPQIHTYKQPHTYTHKNSHIHIHIQTATHIYTYKEPHTYTHTNSHTYKQPYTYTHTNSHTYKHILNECIKYTCLRGCMYVFTCPYRRKFLGRRVCFPFNYNTFSACSYPCTDITKPNKQ